MANKDNLNLQNFEIAETAIYNYAKEVFRRLRNDLGSEKETIELKYLVQLIETFKKDANLKDEIVSYIEDYDIIDYMLKNKAESNVYNTEISEKEFCDFLTGKDIKAILFTDNIDTKRKRIVKIENLYKFMGAKADGLGIEQLNYDISCVKALLDNPENCLKNGFQKNSSQEAQESVNYLASESNVLTLQDFVNVLTSTGDQ